MKTLPVRFHPVALDDLTRIWEMIAPDGAARADKVVARIEAACQGTGAVPGIGTARPEIRAGLRTTGIPKMPKAGTIYFLVTSTSVWIMGISYHGNDVTTRIPRLTLDNPIIVGPSEK